MDFTPLIRDTKHLLLNKSGPLAWARSPRMWEDTVNAILGRAFSKAYDAGYHAGYRDASMRSVEPPVLQEPAFHALVWATSLRVRTLEQEAKKLADELQAVTR